jgi:hypothetical protein
VTAAQQTSGLQAASSKGIVSGCRWKVPGAHCTIRFRVDAGPFSYQFTYFQEGQLRALPRANLCCLDPVCVVTQSGGGGNPPATPEAWLIDGSNPIVISTT